MNATTHTAMILDQHRATDLIHEVELRRRQAERPDSVITRPVGFAAVVGRFTALLRPTRTVRVISTAH